MTDHFFPNPVPRPLPPELIHPCWPVLIPLGCRTRILWVMDGGLDMNPANGFGLTEAKAIVEAATGTRYPVEITTAHRGAGSGCDVTGFRFDTPHTVGSETRTLDDYEEIWIFSISTISGDVSPGELAAIETFMNRGGGMFATGDHADLGAGVCENIPRVKSMRYWRSSAGAPPVSGGQRIDTNVPNPAAGPDFDLQSDAIAQRIYPVWQGVYDADYLPHPVLEMPDGRVVTHLPDHPHEGKCRVPATLDPDEYPGGIGPEIIAWGVSGGAGFSASKTSITPPELFPILCAYDGHEADVGRVVVDSTWHHWLNINLNGTGSGALAGAATNGLYDSGGNPTPEYLEIQRYFQNLAAWLEPTRLRLCYIIDFICWRWRWPLLEEFTPLPRPGLPDLVEIGRGLEAAMRPLRGRGGILETVNGLLRLAQVPADMRRALNPLRRRGKESLLPAIVNEADLHRAVLGGAMNAVAGELPPEQDAAMERLREAAADKGDNPFTPLLAKGARQGLELFLKELEACAGCRKAIEKTLG